MKVRLEGVAVMLFFSIFLVIGAAMLAAAIGGIVKATRASGWPTVTATLQHVELTRDSDSDGTTFKTEVLYSYEVGGATYTGDTVSFGYLASGSKQAHQQIFDKLRLAKRVEARYNPEDPSQSCLAHGITSSHMVFLAFATTWTVFVLGLGSTIYLSGQAEGRLLKGLVVIENIQ